MAPKEGMLPWMISLSLLFTAKIRQVSNSFLFLLTFGIFLLNICLWSGLAWILSNFLTFSIISHLTEQSFFWYITLFLLLTEWILFFHHHRRLKSVEFSSSLPTRKWKLNNTHSFFIFLFNGYLGFIDRCVGGKKISTSTGCNYEGSFQFYVSKTYKCPHV